MHDPSVVATSIIGFLGNEAVFCRVESKFKPPSLVRYAQRRVFSRLGLRPETVRAFTRRHAGALMQATTKPEVDRLLVTVTGVAGTPAPAGRP